MLSYIAKSKTYRGPTRTSFETHAYSQMEVASFLGPHYSTISRIVTADSEACNLSSEIVTAIGFAYSTISRILAAAKRQIRPVRVWTQYEHSRINRKKNSVQLRE